MSTTYTVHLKVTVTDVRLNDEETYEWESVARRVRNRLVLSRRKPLDRDARLRIQSVSIDTAEEA